LKLIDFFPLVAKQSTTPTNFGHKSFLVEMSRAIFIKAPTLVNAVMQRVFTATLSVVSHTGKSAPAHENTTEAAEQLPNEP